MKSIVISIGRWVLRILVLFSLIAILVPAQSTRAAGTWYVAPGGSDGGTCSDPSHPCATIQAAVDKAASGDTIYVAVGTQSESASSYFIVDIQNKDLVLSAGWNSGFTNQIGMGTIDGGGSKGGLRVVNATVTIGNFVIQNGYAAWDGSGGGIDNYGTLTLNHCIIRFNYASHHGGGIESWGALTLNNSMVLKNVVGDLSTTGQGGAGIGNGIHLLTINDSLISGNMVIRGGDGSAIAGGSNMIMNNSTVTDNESINTLYSAIFLNGTTAQINSSTISDNTGIGVKSVYGTLTIQNTIIADNTGNDCYKDTDYTGAVTSLGYNLIESNKGCTLTSTDITGMDPLLQLLQDNGGNTLTKSVSFDSPAIDAGNPAGCSGSGGLLTTDQRGFPRVGICDIGAYESQSPFPSSFIYLPMLSNTGGGTMSGHVTVDGFRAIGVPLDLLFFNGSSWIKKGSTITNWRGDFIFRASALATGQAYCVRFINSSSVADGRLAIWYTPYITSFSEGDLINIGSFDLADVTIGSPAGGATVSLPTTFYWSTRVMTPFDHYQFELFDPAGSREFVTSPDVYNWYTMYSLPQGFVLNKQYGWTVWVNAPDGGYGVAFYYHPITFTSTGSLGSSAFTKGSQERPNRDWREFLIPRFTP